MSRKATLKRHILKPVIAVAVVLTLFGGAKLGVDATATHVAPVHQLQACGGADGLPPCW